MKLAGFHAHIYFLTDADRVAARTLREGLHDRFGDLVKLGRWHEKPIGPHRSPMYQVAFSVEAFAEVAPYIMLNRAGLVVLLHPETGDNLADHTEHAAWMGAVLPLKLEIFR